MLQNRWEKKAPAFLYSQKVALSMAETTDVLTIILEYGACACVELVIPVSV